MDALELAICERLDALEPEAAYLLTLDLQLLWLEIEDVFWQLDRNLEHMAVFGPPIPFVARADWEAMGRPDDVGWFDELTPEDIPT